MWAQMDVNHRSHPYQMCGPIRTVRIMNDQISTVGEAQDVSTKGQCGPDAAVLEQRVAGSFFDFSLTHLHDLREPLCNNGNDHVVRNCQRAGSVPGSTPKSCEARSEAEGRRLTRALSSRPRHRSDKLDQSKRRTGGRATSKMRVASHRKARGSESRCLWDFRDRQRR